MSKDILDGGRKAWLGLSSTDHVLTKCYCVGDLSKSDIDFDKEMNLEDWDT